jgi:sugar phosphate isomerase/epimerase
MDRRSFISKSIVATAAVACYGLSESLAMAKPFVGKKKNRIGIQLYTIREYLDADFTGSLKKIANAGYTHVEAYGFDGNTFLGKTLKETKAIVSDLGMKLSGTHGGTYLLPADIHHKDWDYWRKSAPDMKAAGGKHIVQAFLPAENTLDELKRVADQFNKAGEICKNAGIKFGYHNHYTEFKQVEGQVILDVLLQNTDPNLVFFQLDMGHAVNGGGDILAYLRKYPKRFLSWHASDFKKGQGYVELGQGDVPYDELFKIAKSYGVTSLFMEHESGDDRFDICKRNFDFLAKYPWTK